MSTETQRYDIYRLIHKGVRGFMAETLVALGRMDTEDDADVAETLARVGDLVAFCRHHLANEDRHLHPALEAREPGASATTANDHLEHAHWFDTLADGAAAVAASRGAERAAAAHRLYRRLAVFVGENFLHMETEESANNAVLWRRYSDAELADIEGAIVGSLPPEEKIEALRWMIPSAAAGERARFLAGLRPVMPAPVFEQIIALLRAHLTPADGDKLARALAETSLAA